MRRVESNFEKCQIFFSLTVCLLFNLTWWQRSSASSKKLLWWSSHFSRSSSSYWGSPWDSTLGSIGVDGAPYEARASGLSLGGECEEGIAVVVDVVRPSSDSITVTLGSATLGRPLGRFWCWKFLGGNPICFVICSKGLLVLLLYI